MYAYRLDQKIKNHSIIVKRTGGPYASYCINIILSAVIITIFIIAITASCFQKRCTSFNFSLPPSFRYHSTSTYYKLQGQEIHACPCSFKIYSHQNRAETPSGAQRHPFGSEQRVRKLSPLRPLQKKAGADVQHLLQLGPSAEIRTQGLLNPIQARYQTSPHPVIFAAQGVSPGRLIQNTTASRRMQAFFSIFSILFFRAVSSEKTPPSSCQWGQTVL